MSGPDRSGLPGLDEVAPVMSALLDLVLLDPVGEDRASEVTLSRLDELLRRCGAVSVPSCVDDFRAAVPRLRGQLRLDVRAAYEGDPACGSETEAALCYPGVHAMAIHRVAHELFLMGAPLLPRLLAECMHQRTGIDIHPGASIGHSFFIDHGTGVVIGATATIGAHCTLYQGVTLGTLRVRPGMDAREKRHPTLEDHVVVYAGATILGGETVVGTGCVIGGGVFLTESVPPRHVVTTPRPVVELRQSRKRLPLCYAI